MINYNKICVFDFETDGSDPKCCSPVQIAAVIIDPLKLEIVPNSEFNIFFKPEVLANDEDYQYTTDILDFHAKVRGSSKEAVLAEWKKYPSQDQSWKLFTNYLTMHHSRSSKKSQFSAPIAAGYNINRFDLPIIDRLSRKYGNTNKEDRSDIFYPRDVLDIMNLVFYWFENNSDLKNLSLDTLRDYLGITKDGAHDALKDVKDCAEILVRFMRLHRNLGNKIKFKDSFQSPSHA
jgi:DNA polymerase III epsilon subunit-like protein